MDVEGLILLDEVFALAFQQVEHDVDALRVELCARELVQLQHDGL